MTHEAGHEAEHQDVPAIGLGQRLAPGQAVFTSDGEELGTVKEVQAGYFKVNAPMHPDYWLQEQFVRPDLEGRLMLEFTKDQLDDYKVKELPDSMTAGASPEVHPTAEGINGGNSASAAIDAARSRPA